MNVNIKILYEPLYFVYGMTMDKVCAGYYSTCLRTRSLKNPSYPSPYPREYLHLFSCPMDN